MFFQTKDERKTGYYDNELGSWEELPGSYRVHVRDGIRMAQKLSTYGYYDAAGCLQRRSFMKNLNKYFISFALIASVSAICARTC